MPSFFSITSGVIIIVILYSKWVWGFIVMVIVIIIWVPKMSNSSLRKWHNSEQRLHKNSRAVWLRSGLKKSKQILIKHAEANSWNLFTTTAEVLFLGCVIKLAFLLCTFILFSSGKFRKITKILLNIKPLVFGIKWEINLAI